MIGQPLVDVESLDGAKVSVVGLWGEEIEDLLPPRFILFPLVPELDFHRAASKKPVIPIGIPFELGIAIEVETGDLIM